jgi:hypothetical protein
VYIFISRNFVIKMQCLLYLMQWMFLALKQHERNEGLARFGKREKEKEWAWVNVRTHEYSQTRLPFSLLPFTDARNASLATSRHIANHSSSISLFFFLSFFGATLAKTRKPFPNADCREGYKKIDDILKRIF